MQIAVAHEKVIHLLLTDVIMPGMNGRELAQHICEIRPNVKVLYMSGYTENVIGHNGMLDAGVRLLQKPFNLRDLKSKVREVLDATPTPPEVAMSTQSAAPLHVARARETAPARAQRFHIQLPLRYRRLGEKQWHVGTTENISRSGMLFEADELLQPSAQLEINLVLPAEIAGLSDTEVVCRGEVVRTVQSSGEVPSPAFAARVHGASGVFAVYGVRSDACCKLFSRSSSTAAAIAYFNSSIPLPVTAEISYSFSLCFLQ